MTRSIKSLLFFISITIGQAAFAQSDYQSIRTLLSAGKVIEAEKSLSNIENKDAEYHKTLGDILLQKGDNQKALEQFEMAVNQLESSGNKSSLLTDSYSQLGIAQWTMGNHTEALKYLQKALAIHEANQDKKGVAATINNIGLTYSNYDEDKALEYYERALKSYKEIYDKDDERIAQGHINIGIINGKMGFQTDAYEQFDLALKILERKYGKDHPTQAFVYSSIGVVHASVSEYAEARQYQEMALSIYKKRYGNKHPEIASTYNYLGDIYLAQGVFLGALQQYQEAICANIPVYNNKNIYSLTPIDQYYNPDLLLASIQAKSHALEALHYNKTLKKRDLEAAWNNILLCDSLIDDIRRLKSNEADKIALGARAKEVYEDGIRLSLELADVSWKKLSYQEKAFYFAEKSKSSVLLDAIADANAKSFANLPITILAKEQQLKTDIAYYKQQVAKNSAGNTQSLQNQLFTLEKEYSSFIKDLEKNYPQYYNLKYNVSIPSIADLRAKLEANEALLSYFISSKDNQIYTFYLSDKKFKATRTTKPDDYDRYVSGFRNAIYYDVKDTYMETASKLYDLLIPKTEKGISSLIIIPAGRLGIIPFEALLSEKVEDHSSSYATLPYLLNSYSVRTQYSSALLLQEGSQHTNNQSACVMAPISFKKHNLPSLPATASEISKLDQLFNQNGIKTRSLTYADANEKNIKSSNVSGSKYLHFATHGIVDEASPELSQIFLSSGNSKEDGNLYTGEIYNLKLNAELVTLSACQTGLGKIYEGEGIVGLSRSLLYAGANNMVVSLWSVADRSTADLMVNFYTHVLKNDNYAGSLRIAKQQMIKEDKYAAPYYWAPFILIGQ